MENMLGLSMCQCRKNNNNKKNKIKNRERLSFNINSERKNKNLFNTKFPYQGKKLTTKWKLIKNIVNNSGIKKNNGTKNYWGVGGVSEGGLRRCLVM